MQRTALIALLIGSAIALVACGGGGGGGIDGGPPDAPAGDAAVDGGLTSCAPGVTVTSIPDIQNGTLDGEDATFDLADDSCSVIAAPFGVAASGPDQVLAVKGLAPGVDHAVRLVSSADLAFYVATGCEAGEPPQLDSCLLFVDESTDALEVGTFTAPANGEVVVVVDYWQEEPPSPGGYSLEVYEVECTGNDECSGATPACVDYRCAGCGSDFDCSDPNAPICNELESRCVPGYDQCTGDDPSPPENGDDGPAGARDITPSPGATTMTSGAICNAPVGELDFYRFDVASDGEDYDLELSWAAGVDLDLQVFDARGVPYGLSLFEQPERISLRYLPAGTYYAMVNYAAQTEITTSIAYTLAATRVTGNACNSPTDCASEFRNQFFRSSCTGGACDYRIGGGTFDDGALCDTSSDCSSGSCAAFPFTANADQRSVCTTPCNSDADCAAMGGNYVCTTYLSTNICVQQCTADDQCPVSFNVVPSVGPWFRLRCVLASGKCSF